VDIEFGGDIVFSGDLVLRRKIWSALCAAVYFVLELVITYLSCHFISGGFALECKVLPVTKVGLAVFFHGI
jgi:hypothetical protein